MEVDSAVLRTFERSRPFTCGSAANPNSSDYWYKSRPSTMFSCLTPPEMRPENKTGMVYIPIPKGIKKEKMGRHTSVVYQNPSVYCCLKQLYRPLIGWGTIAAMYVAYEC